MKDWTSYITDLTLLQLTCLFAIAFPLASPSPPASLVVVPPTTSPAAIAPADLLSPNALQALASYTSHHHSVPLTFPGALSDLESSAELAWTRLCADVDSASHGGGADTSTRKRKREEELPQHPSSDVMDVDGMPVPTATRRRKAPWRDAVVKVLKLASVGEELHLETEGVEKIISRLAQ